MKETEIRKCRISFCDDGNVLELDNADICTAYEYSKVHRSVYIKWLKWLIYHNKKQNYEIFSEYLKDGGPVW